MSETISYAEHGWWDYAPESTTMPLPNTSGGMLLSGMSYDKIGRNAPLMAMVPQPGPSPLQMWVAQDVGLKLAPGFGVGSAVRICHLLSGETQLYNGLIGDIIEVSAVDSDCNGTQELLFDVRCPVLMNVMQSRRLIKDAAHFKVPVTAEAQAAAARNRERVAPMYGAMATRTQEGDDDVLPPFVMLSRLPSEKLEPLNISAFVSLTAARSAGRAARMPGHYMGPPPLVREPMWGPPLPTVVEPELPPRGYMPSDEAQFVSMGGAAHVQAAPMMSSGPAVQAAAPVYLRETIGAVPVMMSAMASPQSSVALPQVGAYTAGSYMTGSYAAGGADAFGMLDRNHDGALSREEFNQAFASQRSFAQSPYTSTVMPQGSMAPSPYASAAIPQGSSAPSPHASAAIPQGSMAPSPYTSVAMPQGAYAPSSYASASFPQGSMVLPSPYASAVIPRGPLAPSPYASAAIPQGSYPPQQMTQGSVVLMQSMPALPGTTMSNPTPPMSADVLGPLPQFRYNASQMMTSGSGAFMQAGAVSSSVSPRFTSGSGAFIQSGSMGSGPLRSGSGFITQSATLGQPGTRTMSAYTDASSYYAGPFNDLPRTSALETGTSFHSEAVPWKVM
mmetsp:Transcript_12434/g.31294  ORF Transcript_12434/g.31294 Transcript_12434/m.31294 type:complete len:616 (-) Transcript_12434:225-2072(-)